MKTPIPPRLVPTRELPSYFQSESIPFRRFGRLNIGFGHGRDQYRFYTYPAPADDETMGLFCELHTEDYFEVDTGPHIAIGLRGPVADDPHRGRGLAIGILAGDVTDLDNPNRPIELFKGCPPAPGGPSFFIEDFTINEGTAPVREWQLCTGQDLPELRGYGIYRIDIHVSKDQVWVAIWKVVNNPATGKTNYRFLAQANCNEDGPGYSGNPCSPCPEDPEDKGQGNVFIGTGFSNPETSCRIEDIFVAHWKNQDP
jgi:hypothetical protein